MPQSTISQEAPRDASRITPLYIAPVKIEDLPPDHCTLCYNTHLFVPHLLCYVVTDPCILDALLALMFALLAVFFKVRIYSWVTCLFSFSSLANQRYSTMDMRTISATLALIALTFISTHTQFQGQPVLAPVFPWLRKS